MVALLSLFPIPNCCDQKSEPRSRRSPEAPSSTLSSPTRSSSEALGRRSSPFRSVSLFVLAFLRQTCLTMSVLRYHLCVWLIYLGPHDPWFIIWRFMFKFEFRVVLWYLPVSLWSRACTFACMISAWSSRGITSWYQSRLPVGSPLPIPWSKLSLVFEKLCFTNMAVWLTGPRRQWVVLGSFIPHLYSGTLISLLFGLKILLTLTLGSRNHFLPGEPLDTDVPVTLEVPDG